jgi:hypothetical protein
VVLVVGSVGLGVGLVVLGRWAMILVAIGVSGACVAWYCCC